MQRVNEDGQKIRLWSIACLILPRHSRVGAYTFDTRVRVAFSFHLARRSLSIKVGERLCEDQSGLGLGTSGAIGGDGHA